MPSASEVRGATVAGRIVTALRTRARKSQAAEVRIGLSYTAVKLEDGSAGVALTFRQYAECGCASFAVPSFARCSAFDGLLPLAGCPASDLLPRLLSGDPVEAAVGLACANAMANRPGDGQQGGDILDLLDLGSRDHVGMVGHFAPLVEAVRRRAGKLTIFERIDEPDGYLRPADEAEKVLPGCQVALITATSIINHTLDDLLTASRNCREVVILGASTPLLPEVFAATPVTLLSGVLVTDSDAILRTVSEGGGMRLFKPHILKVNLPIARKGKPKAARTGK
jgi:uncharacterized protein (DUF4213/DUF364 family)